MASNDWSYTCRIPLSENKFNNQTLIASYQMLNPPQLNTDQKSCLLRNGQLVWNLRFHGPEHLVSRRAIPMRHKWLAEQNNTWKDRKSWKHNLAGAVGSSDDFAYQIGETYHLSEEIRGWEQEVHTWVHATSPILERERVFRIPPEMSVEELTTPCPCSTYVLRLSINVR